jgi:hypothetical protein
LRSLDPAAGRRIGTAARARLLAAHTYDHRAQEVDALLTGRLLARPQMAV